MVKVLKLIKTIDDIEDHNRLMRSMIPSIKILLYPFIQGLKPFTECIPKDDSEISNFLRDSEHLIFHLKEESEILKAIDKSLDLIYYSLINYLNKDFYIYILDGTWVIRRPKQKLEYD